jgi:hypothetical protein
MDSGYQTRSLILQRPAKIICAPVPTQPRKPVRKIPRKNRPTEHFAGAKHCLNASQLSEHSKTVLTEKLRA